MTAYATLFATAFLAATILPFQSEFLLAALLLDNTLSPSLLLAVATAGNTLGSAANWLLGRFLLRFRGRWWFPVPDAQYQRAMAWYRRWGMWSLLLSWMPVIGDPLTVAAGVLRLDFRRFLAVVLVAKGGRYLLVALAVRALALAG